MAKVRVTIEFDIPDDLKQTPGYGGKEGILAWMTSLTLADALAEFASARTPAENYVAERYSGPDYDWVRRNEKVQMVKARNAIALAMHTGQKSIEEVYGG